MVREKVVTGRAEKEREKEKVKVKHRRRSEGTYGKGGGRKVISGPVLEEGRFKRARGEYVGADEKGRRRRRFGKKCWVGFGVVVLLLVILIPVAIVVSRKKSGPSGGSGSSGSGSDLSNSNLNKISENNISTAAENTILDSFT